MDIPKQILTGLYTSEPPEEKAKFVKVPSCNILPHSLAVLNFSIFQIQTF